MEYHFSVLKEIRKSGMILVSQETLNEQRGNPSSFLDGAFWATIHLGWGLGGVSHCHKTSIEVADQVLELLLKDAV